MESYVLPVPFNSKVPNVLMRENLTASLACKSMRKVAIPCTFTGHTASAVLVETRFRFFFRRELENDSVRQIPALIFPPHRMYGGHYPSMVPHGESLRFPASHLPKVNMTIYVWMLGNDKWCCGR